MKIIAVANQKGGVGKTTTAVNVAAGLAAKGKRVLCVDLDHQGNLSEYLGYDSSASKSTITTLLTLPFQASSGSVLSHVLDATIQRNEAENLDYIPADIHLSAVETHINSQICRESILRGILHDKHLAGYDYIIIDCSPSLGVLTVNAVTAADEVLIPVQLQKFSYDGLSLIEDVFYAVKQSLNPTVEIIGILGTMCENTNMTQAVDGLLNRNYQGLVFSTKISRLSEAATSTVQHKSLINMKNSRLGKQYMAVVDELLTRENELKPTKKSSKKATRKAAANG